MTRIIAILLSVVSVSFVAQASVEITMKSGDRMNIVLSTRQNANGEEFLLSCGEPSNDERLSAIAKGRNILILGPAQILTEAVSKITDASTGHEIKLKVVCLAD